MDDFLFCFLFLVLWGEAGVEAVEGGVGKLGVRGWLGVVPVPPLKRRGGGEGEGVEGG